ncbi:hypothetical protein EVAR_95692_1 [Eumeta japonica]|uniref:Uncharacterized protein n=1 Tax=Eumeta variegata TaxID=151549 RepID=A0A4C1VKL3_EUMVA|nr:hypothetical protein EVAR_95692_1 [Eumeta japonica]
MKAAHAREQHRRKSSQGKYEESCRKAGQGIEGLAISRLYDSDKKPHARYMLGYFNSDLQPLIAVRAVFVALEANLHDYIQNNTRPARGIAIAATIGIAIVVEMDVIKNIGDDVFRKELAAVRRHCARSRHGASDLNRPKLPFNSLLGQASTLLERTDAQPPPAFTNPSVSIKRLWDGICT